MGLDRVHCANCYFVRGGKCAYEEIMKGGKAMGLFERLPLVSDGVYERVEAERKQMDTWDALVIGTVITRGLSWIGDSKGRLANGITSVGADLKPKQRRAIASDLYFLLRLINDALAERG